MLVIELRFPGGYYHATPWGRHVNEGAVEWPPSPWRFLRGLVAAGFRTQWWQDVPPTTAALIEKLASALPTFHLPEVSAGHTRHYMPVFKGSPDKVIDAFAYVGDQPVSIEWPIELNDAELREIDVLLGGLSYLGRAESWVDARRVERAADGLRMCAPAEVAPGPRYERAPRLAPLSASELSRWRETALAREHERVLSDKNAKATAKGKKAAAKLSKADAAKIDAMFPASVIDALRVDTAELAKQGWSQPPGSRWVSYWLAEDALAPKARVRVSASAERPDTALFAVAADTKRAAALPALETALARGELLHSALAGIVGSDRACPCLTGKDEREQPLEGHQHAHVFSLSLRSTAPGARRRSIDHLLVHAPMGFDAEAVRALRSIRKTYAKDLPDLWLALVGLGTKEALREQVHALRNERIWVSSTPFVPPRYLKPAGRNGFEGQVREELRSRGFPEPARVEVELEGRADVAWAPAEAFWDLWRGSIGVEVGRNGDGGDTVAARTRLSTRWRHFRRERASRAKKPPQSAAFGLRITFDEDVAGPIAIGYGSHFGLGLMVPA